MVHVSVGLTRLISLFAGAASDKVTALEKAGVIVTDSPAKIGATMLKVTASHLCRTTCS